MTRVTRVTPTTRTSLPNTKNQRRCCPSKTTRVTLQFMGSTSVASVAASGALVAASGVVCDSSLFSLEIAVSTELLISDGARAKSSVSLIKQVAFVGQQHVVFGLQGRVVDVAHVDQAHPCYKSRTASLSPCLSCIAFRDFEAVGGCLTCVTSPLPVLLHLLCHNLNSLAPGNVNEILDM